MKGTTSTGVGKRPSRSTSFESSTMTMKRLAAIARAFSRKRAPPPPLVRDQSGATSSAPSITTSIAQLMKGTTGTPNSPHSCSVPAEVTIATSFSPAATRSPVRLISSRA